MKGIIVQSIFCSNRVFYPILQNNLVFGPPKWCIYLFFLLIYHIVNWDVTERSPKDKPKKMLHRILAFPVLSTIIISLVFVADITRALIG